MELGIAERVKAKEAAVDIALQRLEALSTTLESARSDPSVDKFLEHHSERFIPFSNSYRTITNQHQELTSGQKHDLQILVGVGGETGFGKTSLLNAVVGGTAILPSSESEACTAAVCLFAYNHHQDSAWPFRAKITFKTRDTVEFELRSLLNELGELSEETADATADGDSRAYEAQLKAQLCIIESWSGISRNKIEKMQASDIIRQCSDARSMFHFSTVNLGQRKEKNISAKNASDFLRLLKPYIDSSKNHRGAARHYWPIVEHVHIFVKSEILKKGLVLVDLPGEVDALEARSQISKAFYSRLDKMMVVTHAIRAADNRTASDLMVGSLLPQDTMTDLTVDGMTGKDNLCVVISKIDDINWKSFITNMENAPEEVTAEWHAFESIGSELKGVRAEIQELENDEKHAVGEINGTNTPHNPNKRRHSGMNTKTLGDSIGGSSSRAKQMASLKDRMADLITQKQRLEAKLVRAAVEMRNADLVEKTSESLRMVKNWKGTVESTGDGLCEEAIAKIFPVSSRAFSQLEEGDPMIGFPDTQSTGIDDLKGWLNEVTLPKREFHADNMIRECRILFDHIQGWALGDDFTSERRLGSKEIERIQHDIQIKVGGLKKVSS
jgi:hypothetical protein